MHLDLKHLLQETWPKALPMTRKAKVGFVDEDSKKSACLPEVSQQVLTDVRGKRFRISEQKVEVRIGNKLCQRNGLADTINGCTTQGGGH